jgi:pyridoxine/pyridoxamine 5'-phosphate oxidase
MRTLLVLVALLGTVVALQAKEADSLRAARSVDATVKQIVSNQSGQLAKPARTRSDGHKDRDFSAQAIVPDICTGC